ncbi:MAG: Ig-like domain-containing protein [Bacteroidota bacterium]|jgi:hypothetical protein|nr:Ig-like domain-containing protein [Chitinophagaceae bacterium]
MYRLFILALMGFIAVGCGQQVPPTGGPKDTLPPKLLMALPDYKSTQFKSEKIILTFDEYVSLDNPFEKVTFSPVPKYNPVVESKLKTVTIKIKDTLEENTTYRIDFGESVRDINENNILRNLNYTFSTGSYIDSAYLTGNVIIAESGKIDSTIIVVLHRNLDDSAVAKEKPRYYSKLKGDGSYIFSNLKPGRYNLFAIKDNDGGKKYDQVSELIAFLDKPLEIGRDTIAKLFAFEEFFEVVPPKKPTVASSNKKDEDKRLRLINNLDANKQDILGDFLLTSIHPLKTFDSGKIRLYDKTFKINQSLKISRDSTNKKIMLSHKWVEGAEYNLVIEKDVATDTMDNKYMKTDTIAFSAKRTSDYGTVKIKIDNLDTSSHPVLMLKKDNNTYFQQRLVQKNYSIPLILPGDFEISILFDSNKNGKWDTGNYWKKIQPERVVARKETFNVRPNWENELSIDLSTLQ